MEKSPAPRRLSQDAQQDVIGILVESAIRALPNRKRDWKAKRWRKRWRKWAERMIAAPVPEAHRSARAEAAAYVRGLFEIAERRSRQ